MFGHKSFNSCNNFGNKSNPSHNQFGHKYSHHARRHHYQQQEQERERRSDLEKHHTDERHGYHLAHNPLHR